MQKTFSLPVGRKSRGLSYVGTAAVKRAASAPAAKEGSETSEAGKSRATQLGKCCHVCAELPRNP
ncbi:UNVERIFIED_CONTAM: hypothetical protein K2H54_070689, partial [Gekko kuhli]